MTKKDVWWEAQKHAEELLWVVGLLQVELGSIGGLNVACIGLPRVIMSHKMFKDENRGEQERKQENQLNCAQPASALFLFLLQLSLP